MSGEVKTKLRINYDPKKCLRKGKYGMWQGTNILEIDKIPDDYLTWALNNWEPGDSDYDLIEKEFIRRKQPCV